LLPEKSPLSVQIHRLISQIQIPEVQYPSFRYRAGAAQDETGDTDSRHHQRKAPYFRQDSFHKAGY
jgi:hypothetical protein